MNLGNIVNDDGSDGSSLVVDNASNVAAEENGDVALAAEAFIAMSGIG